MSDLALHPESPPISHTGYCSWSLTVYPLISIHQAFQLTSYVTFPSYLLDGMFFKVICSNGVNIYFGDLLGASHEVKKIQIRQRMSHPSSLCALSLPLMGSHV